jgi:hypothetical chaperone protein
MSNTMFGIDFGTSNSALSILQDGDVEVVPIDNKNFLSPTLKSILYFHNGEREVGQRAVNSYLENKSIGRLIQSLKRFLSCKNFHGTEIDGHFYTPDALASLIISEVKQIGEMIAGCSVDTVALGRPVVFSTDAVEDSLAEERLKSAAYMAGFTNVTVEFEPYAAALSFIRRKKIPSNGIVLIGDMGGGTCDFSIIKVTSDILTAFSKKEHVLGVGGIYTGGNALTAELMYDKVAPLLGSESTYKSGPREDPLDVPVWIYRKMSEWHMAYELRSDNVREILSGILRASDSPEQIAALMEVINTNRLFDLFQLVDGTKQRLSTEESVDVKYELSEMTLSFSVTRDEFESAISRQIRNIGNCLDETLENASLTQSDITQVVLTGGTSLIPSIRKMFTSRFGESSIVEIDAFTGVADGLGLSFL